MENALSHRNMNPPEPENRHAEHVIRLARQLANGTRPGVLATTDEMGRPQMRWMSTLNLEEFPHLYALTALSSAKVKQIQANPRVSWMFTSESGEMVVNLYGMAVISSENAVVNRAWRMIEDKSRAYFLDLDPEKRIAVIDTHIEQVDCVMPKYNLHYPIGKKAFKFNP